ncbi:MAG: DUF2029 domain-containing protein [Rhodospirillales bacterium]|nr:DUF2029 domain-containing protein [Rhodospirillales bacterium]
MTRNDWRLAAFGAAQLALFAAIAVLLAGRPPGNPGPAHTLAVVAIEIAAGATWLGACLTVRRGPAPRFALPLALGVALGMRALLLPGPPPLSSDLYRYVWDGRVAARGINPYRYRPADPALAFQRDRTVFPRINRAATARTIYPPAAEIFFRLAATLAPGVTGMKLALAACDLGVIAALIALLRRIGRPAAEVLVYAWAPMPALEFAGNGHVDALAALFVALALLAASGRRDALAGMALGAAALVKFLPAAIAPAFRRRGAWRLPLVFAATVALLYLPYLGAGRHVLGFLPGYARQEGLLSGRGVFLLDLIARLSGHPPPRWAGLAYAAALALLLGFLALRFGLDAPLPAAPGPRVAAIARPAALLGAVLLVGIAPHYPWYFGWLAPLVCLVPAPALLWLIAASPGLTLDPAHHVWIAALVYLPAAALAATAWGRSA